MSLNWDNVLNEIHAAEESKISYIRIIKAPKEPGIHDKIQEGWVGTELEAKGPYLRRGARVYEVSRETALETLKRNSEASWRWFFYGSMRIPAFYFSAECCQEISKP